MIPVRRKIRLRQRVRAPVEWNLFRVRSWEIGGPKNGDHWCSNKDETNKGPTFCFAAQAGLPD